MARWRHRDLLRCMRPSRKNLLVARRAIPQRHLSRKISNVDCSTIFLTSTRRSHRNHQNKHSITMGNSESTEGGGAVAYAAESAEVGPTVVTGDDA